MYKLNITGYMIHPTREREQIKRADAVGTRLHCNSVASLWAHFRQPPITVSGRMERSNHVQGLGKEPSLLNEG